jgi:hypothetical protein
MRQRWASGRRGRAWVQVCAALLMQVMLLLTQVMLLLMQAMLLLMQAMLLLILHWLQGTPEPATLPCS